MTDQEKIDFLSNAIRTIKNKDFSTTINRDTELTSIGIDSLDAVELQMYYEEETGVETRDPESAVRTVGDLIDLMP